MSLQYVDVDTILQHVGEFSTYQIFIVFLSCLVMFPSSYPNLIMYFGALDPKWKCVSNSTSCKLNGTQETTNTLRCRINREEWEFTEPKTYSIVTEFDLVCGTSWLMYVTTSIYFLGWIVGAFLLGWLADRYGRKKIYFPVMFSIIACVMGTAFSPNIYVFILLRFVTGFLKPGGALVLFVIVSELVRGKYRPLAGMTLWVAYGVAMCVMGVKAYFIREWKTLFIVCSAPYFFLLCIYPCIPESLRWQRLRGKTDEAVLTLRKIASCNKKPFPEHMRLKEELKDEINVSYVELFNSKIMAIRSLIQGFSWIAFGMVYYGLSFAASDLGGNLYSTYILVNGTEIPAAMIAIYLLNKFGRRRSIIASCFIASGSLIIIAVLITLDRFKVARITFAMLGKFFITVAFDAIYTWSLEIYPTYIRGQAMGYLQVVSRVGAASSPWVAKSLRRVHRAAPFVLMGCAGFISGVLLSYLPETRNRRTSEVAADIILEGKKDVEEQMILTSDEFHEDFKKSKQNENTPI